MRPRLKKARPSERALQFQTVRVQSRVGQSDDRGARSTEMLTMEKIDDEATRVLAGEEGKRHEGAHMHKRSTFVFKGVTFVVPGKQQEKKIIQDVDCVLESGQVLAILGPSGAGKTTLINCLTLNAAGGTTYGEITLDGEPMTADTLRTRCFVVQQKDNHWPFLTCRETMSYAADLYLPSEAPEARRDLVERLLKKMGLDSCADTRVGNEFLQGLSGGQKRRLSIAIALIKEPDLLFLDEPTSGLDAAAAANIMVFIKQLAIQDNLIVVATIHQPSSKIYDAFDRLMILSQGKLAYQGVASEAIPYFAAIGHGLPEFTNPAEYFLDLVNSDFVEQDEVDRVLDAWDTSEQKARATELVPKSDSAEPYTKAGLLAQIRTMVRRQTLNASRDPLFLLGRCIIFLCACTYFSIVYITQRDRDQDQVINKFWLNVWFIGVPSNMGVVAVYAYNVEYKAIYREIRNGMVSPVSYLFANFILQIPLVFAFGFFALGIPGYAIGNFWGPNFGTMVVVYAAAMFAFESIAQVLSVVAANPLLGMLAYVGTWFSGFLFAGFLIPVDEIVWPFRVLAYVLPLRYTVRSMAFLEFSDTTWEACSESTNSTCGSAEICYGDPLVTGRQDGRDVLESLSEVFATVDRESHLVLDTVIVLALAVFCKVCYIAQLIYLVNRMSVVKKPVQPLK